MNHNRWLQMLINKEADSLHKAYIGDKENEVLAKSCQVSKDMGYHEEWDGQALGSHSRRVPRSYTKKYKEPKW